MCGGNSRPLHVFPADPSLTLQHREQAQAAGLGSAARGRLLLPALDLRGRNLRLYRLALGKLQSKISVSMAQREEDPQMTQTQSEGSHLPAPSIEQNPMGPGFLKNVCSLQLLWAQSFMVAIGRVGESNDSQKTATRSEVRKLFFPLTLQSCICGSPDSEITWGLSKNSSFGGRKNFLTLVDFCLKPFYHPVAITRNCIPILANPREALLAGPPQFQSPLPQPNRTPIIPLTL